MNVTQSSEESAQNGNADVNDCIEMEVNESEWDDKEAAKSSEDEEDAKQTNRYDRFGHSEENDNADMPKTVDDSVIEEDADQKS